MSTLIAIGYPDAQKAEEVRGVMIQATKERLIDLQDALGAQRQAARRLMRAAGQADALQLVVRIGQDLRLLAPVQPPAHHDHAIGVQLVGVLGV